MDKSLTKHPRRILLVAPTHMDLYKDIIAELERQMFFVEFIAVKAFPRDPFLVCGKYSGFYSKERFLSSLKEFWIQVYNSNKYSFDYDYLLVINGTCVHPILFEMLRKKNPSIKCINYLFDSAQHVYRFDRNFPYYDKVYSFDPDDVERFGLLFLPIYWLPIEYEMMNRYKFFGFGAYNHRRFLLFQTLKSLSCRRGEESYIHLYYPNSSFTILDKVKNTIKRIQGISEAIHYSDFKSGIITHNTLTPSDFRSYVASSEIIIETANELQRGLTARCMWALGAGKKIITSNRAIMKYPFFSHDQVLVVDSITGEAIPESFLNKPFSPSEEFFRMIEKWRIDNWIKTLLS